jgi:very-short-patch-repair endonuclease
VDEIELEMEQLLKDVGLRYVAQFPVGQQHFPAKCRSRFKCWRQGEDVDDDEEDNVDVYDWSGGEEKYCDGDYSRGCKYKIPSRTYPKYILDFAVYVGTHKIDVECDGFAYHSSPSQVASDVERTKYLESFGWVVQRFAGTTIHSRKGEVKKILTALVKSLQDINHEQGQLF